MEHTNKKLLVTGGMIILCLFLFVAFPASNIFQKMIVYATFFITIPILYVKIVLREDLKNYGLQKGDWRKGLLWGGLSLAASLAVFYLILHYTKFALGYHLSPFATDRFFHFMLYEIFLVGFFVFIYEFFFRGIVMFSLAPKARGWSIVIQFIMFILLLYFTHSFRWSMTYFMIGAAFSGVVAYQGRSLIYSISANWIFIVIADSLVIKMLK
jgi:membrane protease YdiL (CAAX protease family)